MPLIRKEYSRGDLRFHRALQHWNPGPAGGANIYRDFLSPEEIVHKRRRFAAAIAAAARGILEPIDTRRDWDHQWAPLCERIARCSLLDIMTGDRNALKQAKEALAAIARCPRPHFTYSTCMGVLDLDLRTAAVIEACAMMRSAFGDRLDDKTTRTLDEVAVERCLRPGLEAMRTKRYAWMHNKANWRIILPGSFAIGAMAWADRIADWREYVAFGIDGLLAAYSTGDEQGGWNEGPGYWEYGVGAAVTITWAIRQFTRGAVDLFQHPFLARTGDFRLYMHTRPRQVWNWSDAGKNPGASSALAILARAYQNKAYQWLLFREGGLGLTKVFHVDAKLPHTQPPRGLPLTKHFTGLGVAVARTGFGERDTYVGVKAGDMPDFNHHCQMDAGGLVIHGGGGELLAENDHWGYPREAPKDPKAPRPSRPGLYDEELKRWKRWDLDSVSAVGHNIPVIEGCFPQAKLHVPPRLSVLKSNEKHDIFLVDSTPYYTPLATRVVRAVVYLRPATVIVVDDIVARKPVRTRVQFHYLEHAALEHDKFRITTGKASLVIRPLWPGEEDNRIMGMDDRVTSYETPSEIVQRRNRFAYVENLWRKPRLTFVTVMNHGGGKVAPVDAVLEGDPASGDFVVRVGSGRGAARVMCNLRSTESPVVVRWK